MFTKAAAQPSLFGLVPLSSFANEGADTSVLLPFTSLATNWSAVSLSIRSFVYQTFPR
jgi:hypothetical protein